MRVSWLSPLTHHYPNCRGRNSKCRYLVSFDNFPKAINCGKVRRTTIQQYSSAEMMITDDGPRSHHPSNVAQPEKTVIGLMIKCQIDFARHLCQEPGMGMNRAFGLAGSP